MSANPAFTTGVAPALGRARQNRAAGNIGAPFAIAAIAAVIVLYHETIWSMVALWSRSQTFAHGFMIVPISAWLVWRQRRQLASLPQQPSIAAFLVLLGLGAIWLVASVANVQVLAQYAVTAMIAVTAVAILGWQAARSIAFPLAYLLLAVPFGEIFVPPLMDFTARFTVAALQLTGVPVFRENNTFSIPSGNWSVVDACSGLRYVIASLALGALYAHLNYHSTRRRLVFIGVALVLPVFANGVRAYLIVMIGHWSGMRLAVGVDHLIYGWVFFGFVSLLLFWSGSFWRDQPLPMRETAAPAPARPGARRRLAFAAAACIAISAGWSLIGGMVTSAKADAKAPARLAFAAPAPWQEGTWPGDGWQASHAGTPLCFARTYRNGRGPVAFQVAWYLRQGKDAELLTPPPPPSLPQAWREIEGGSKTMRFGARDLTVRQMLVEGTGARLLVWRWYRQSGVDTISAPLVKLLIARGKLLPMREDGAELIVSAPFDGSAAAQTQLHDFVAAMLPAIDQDLHVARR